MTIKREFDARAYLELMQATMDIPMREKWKAGICAHLANAARMAEIVEAADLDPDSLVLASVFEAGNCREAGSTEEPL